MIPRQSPRNKTSYFEYAIEAGGSILSHKRYDTPWDAYFEILKRKGNDRIRSGKEIVKRRVVGRKVTIGDWEPVRTDEGVWENGTGFEYEFAYCSVCGRMEFADFNSHADAKKKIKHFHEEYKFCPGCGAKMTGGRYIE